MKNAMGGSVEGISAETRSFGLVEFGMRFLFSCREFLGIAGSNSMESPKQDASSVYS